MKSLIFVQTSLLTVTIFMVPLLGLSQEQSNLHSIDSIVSQINYSKFTETKDTANNDMPAYSIFISTLQTAISDGNKLKKYVHRVVNFDDQQKKVITADYVSTFYYNNDTLIKIEETGDDKHDHFKVFWYFDNTKLIKVQMQPMPADNEYKEKIKGREQLLIGLSKSFLATFHSKHPTT